ncbi:hypothetical protein FOL47_006633 [Perkinsus chesapeaki]|uniref:Uncharacterized protein n=1 Tax=Perkinsus chesapeaki TaxID=330153 RepID=A0A7J6LQR7_PERCH|nr:hypothetical protein FOL47_006633 [Perkinsus chesapeaki]
MKLATAGIFNLIIEVFGSNKGSMVSGMVPRFIPLGVYQTTGDVPFFSHFILRIKPGNKGGLEFLAGQVEHNFIQSVPLPDLKMDMSSLEIPGQRCWLLLCEGLPECVNKIKQVSWILKRNVGNTPLPLRSSSIVACMSNEGNVILNLRGKEFPMRKVSDEPDFALEKPIEVPEDGWYVTVGPVDGIDSVSIHLENGEGEVIMTVNGHSELKKYHTLKIHPLAPRSKTKTRCYEIAIRFSRRIILIKLAMFDPALGHWPVMICRDRELVTYLALGQRYVRLVKDDGTRGNKRENPGEQQPSRKRKNTNVYSVAKKLHAATEYEEVLPKVDITE